MLLKRLGAMDKYTSQVGSYACLHTDLDDSAGVDVQ